MTDDATSLWWESITGPRMLIEKLAASLAEGKSIALQTDGVLPWREAMRDLVMNRLITVQLYLVRWQQGCGRNEVAPRLLQNFRRRQAAMCPSEYTAQMVYLKNERIFGNTVIWVIPEGTQGLDQLLPFLSDYRGRSVEEHGAFVAELPSDYSLPPFSAGMEAVRSSDYIRGSDVRLFASILADGNRQLSPELKPYAACVCANLGEKHVELIPAMLQWIDFRTEDPGEALLRLFAEERIPTPPEGVPGRAELEQTVWKSQLETVFSGIEMERLQIAGAHAREIEEALTTQYWNPREARAGYIDQRGDELRTALDVELGTMTWMMNLRRSDDWSRYLLYFSDEDLRERIFFLTDCRNTLAHHKVCAPDDLYRLLCMLER